MRQEEVDKAWTDFLSERQKPMAPDPEFTRKVMAEVGAQAVARNGSAGGARQPLWQGLREGWRRIWERPVAGLAMASLLVLAGGVALYVSADRPPAAAGPDVTRIKGGGFKLGFLLKRGGAITPAEPGAVYLPGDRLQAIYSSPAAGHIQLFSLDEAGNIACLSCRDGNPELPAGQGKPLAYALELDGSAAAEAMVGFWGPQAVPGSSVEAGLRGAWERSGHDFPRLQSILTAESPRGSAATVFLIHKRGKI